ncbi:MAG: DNA mismatch repair protein MutS [Myxococcales bacterium]
MNSPADTNASPGPGAAAVHSELQQRFSREMADHERRSQRLSVVRLLTFVGGAVLVAAGVSTGGGLEWTAGIALLVAFLVAVVLHHRVIVARGLAETRRDIHERHLWRLRGKWQQLPGRGEELLPRDHPYAFDVDLVGRGSLFQRIDVSHTVAGGARLARWLGTPTDAQTVARRQTAVEELAAQVELRQELEAAALRKDRDHRLDGRAFREFAELPSYFAPRPWLTPAIFALPPLTLLLYVLGSAGLVPSPSWLLPVAAQLSLLIVSARPVREAFDLAAARQGVVEAFEHLLRVVEQTDPDSELLREIRARIAVGDTPPSAHMRRLKSWASAAELRQQFLFHVFINPLTLWDLHVLRGLEAWNRDVGRHTTDWFEALGELEALSSLATLAFGDPDAVMPEIEDSDAPLECEALAHPLLPPDGRVANDLSLQGPGTAAIVTGSNMAGKSTLLRAVGLNVALALAGGPVCARRMRVPQVRLRASMRVQDSLQEGASYFHAELSKLRSVVDGAEDRPPVLFLLDELLRGTNAHARHVGGAAVVKHMLARGATGLVATHDVALSELEQELPGRIQNLHFTDVVEDGEMRFDYRLRRGVVKTSNALRLLAMAGIEVPEDDRVRDDEVRDTAEAARSPEHRSPGEVG